MIETPCGTRIEILPKHVELSGTDDQSTILAERELMQKMFSVSLYLQYREAGSANLNLFKQPLHECNMTQFLVSFERLVQCCLRFDYNRVQDEEKFLRGKLQLVKYMRHPPTKKLSF